MIRLFVWARYEQIADLRRNDPGLTPKRAAFLLSVPLDVVYKTLRRCEEDRRLEKRSSEDRRKKSGVCPKSFVVPASQSA
jgi:hypothetical protein